MDSTSQDQLNPDGSTTNRIPKVGLITRKANSAEVRKPVTSPKRKHSSFSDKGTQTDPYHKARVTAIDKLIYMIDIYVAHLELLRAACLASVKADNNKANSESDKAGTKHETTSNSNETHSDDKDVEISRDDNIGEDDKNDKASEEDDSNMLIENTENEVKVSPSKMTLSNDKDMEIGSDGNIGEDVKNENASEEEDNNLLTENTENNVKVTYSKMITLGRGYAAVPASVYSQINWSTYTDATRKLLTAVFSRKILATHNLTGRPSPAFPDIPVKRRLDPLLVDDIIQTVCGRCNVPENIVRTCITTICANEGKIRKQAAGTQKRSLRKEKKKSPQTSSSSEQEEL